MIEAEVSSLDGWTGTQVSRVQKTGPCNSDGSALEHRKTVLERVIGLAAWTYISMVVCYKMVV